MVFRLNARAAFVIFVIVDTLCIGLGMGVPILCILFGFVVGWYIAKRATLATANVKDVLWKVLVHALITSAFTFVVMSAIWGRTIVMLFDPSADFQNFGHPFILYDPKISFIGWLVLMIFISPFLQLLTTIFGSYLTLLLRVLHNSGYRAMMAILGAIFSGCIWSVPASTNLAAL